MRLTYKSNGEYLADSYIDEAMIAFIDKLGQLEDIEEELGIDLITLFKILTAKRLFKKHNDKVCEIFAPYALNCSIDVQNKCFTAADSYYNTNGYYLSFKDYGKTWALTEEELC